MLCPTYPTIPKIIMTRRAASPCHPKDIPFGKTQPIISTPMKPRMLRILHTHLYPGSLYSCWHIPIMPMIPITPTIAIAILHHNNEQTASGKIPQYSAVPTSPKTYKKRYRRPLFVTLFFTKSPLPLHNPRQFYQNTFLSPLPAIRFILQYYFITY